MADSEPKYASVKSDKRQPVQAIAYTQAYDNAGYYSTSSLRKGGAYSLGSEQESGDYTRRASRKRCYVILAIVLLALLLIAAIVVGLYFGVIAKPEPKQPSPTTTSTTKEPTQPTPQPQTRVSYEVILTLDDDYSTALDDPGTQEYIDLKEDVETLMNDVMEDSDLSEWYVRTTVTGFRRGSKLVLVKIDFSSRTVQYDNQNLVLSNSKILSVVKVGLAARPMKVLELKVKTAEIEVKVLQRTGNVDLGGECSDFTDCSDENTECSGSDPSVCKCIPDIYYDSNSPDRLGGTCNPKIPYGGSTCTASRQCITPDAVCFNGQCICDKIRHYLKNEACVPKIELNEPGCEETSHCAGSDKFCDGGVCVCHPVTHFFQFGQCEKKKEVGESGCNLDWHCADDGTVCQNGVCICNPKTLYFTGVECALKKDFGDLCNVDSQCTTSVCKDSVCDCLNEDYYDGTDCSPKKWNGEHCLRDAECKVTDAYCDTVNKICTCSPIKYLDGTICTDRKGYDQSCNRPVECLPPFECRMSKCMCAKGYDYIGGTCLLTTTTKTTKKTTPETVRTTTKETVRPSTEATTTKTTKKTTPLTVKTTTKETVTPSTEEITTTTSPPPPEEIPTVELNGSVTSDTPYDPELADTGSALYQNYSQAFKAAIEEGLKAEGQEGTVTNITFSEGSLKMNYILVLSVKIVEIPTTRQEIQELPSRVVAKIKPVLAVVITELTQNVDVPDFLQQIDVTEPVEVEPVPDPPCRNGEKMLDYAEHKVCGEILKHFKQNPYEDVCSTYKSLLDCVSLMYMYDTEFCPWNNMRAHFERKALSALGLNRDAVEDCFPRNDYKFTPVADILAETPCMDVHLMAHVARYECRTNYMNMLMPGTNICSEGKQLSTCVMKKLKYHYQSCIQSSSSTDYWNTVLVEYQSEFFPDQEFMLQECEYCLRPNIEYLMMSKCGAPLQFMNLWPWDGADCNNLHVMIRCVEAQTLKWTTNTCPLKQIVDKIKASKTEFFEHFKHVSAFYGNGFSQCLDQTMMSVGPPVTQNLCLNHNYIVYLFVYKCTTWERINNDMVTDQCSEHLQAVQCVVEYFIEEEQISCGYNGIFSAVWEKRTSYEYSIVDTLKMTGYPGADCAEHYLTNTGQCQVSFYSQYDNVQKDCIPDIDEDLETTLMSWSDIACGAFAETTRCSMRLLGSGNTCQLQDIEPVLRASYYRKYEDKIPDCPSLDSGPFEEKVLCEEIDSLGAKMLETCGSFLIPPSDAGPYQCRGVKDFGECALSENSMLVGICDRLTVARAFHSLEDGLIMAFKVSKSCFVEHSGLCKQSQDTCADVTDGGKTCLLDDQCGGLEKCCSNGCYMECTTNIRDPNPDAGMFCPSVRAGETCYNPVDACYVDAHCPGSSVCCSDGCQNYCLPTDMERIYTPDDCRKEEIIKAALMVCSESHPLSDSCRSFIGSVGCVQEKLDAISVGVKCKIENTRDDVALRVRDQIGVYSQCRVFLVDLKIYEGRCMDVDIADEGTEQNAEYMNEVSPLVELVLDGLEYYQTGVEFEDDYNCNPPVLLIEVYKVDTVLELGEVIRQTLYDLTKSGQLKKTVELRSILYKYVDFDKCKDPPTLRREMMQCLKSEFNDKSYPREYNYQTCRAVDDLAQCMVESYALQCEKKEIKYQLFVDKHMVIERLKMQTDFSQFTEAVERYDFFDCIDRGDVEPCLDKVKIDDALMHCTADVDLSGFTVNGDVNYNFGLTPELCRNYYDIAFCVYEDLNGFGTKCPIIFSPVYNAVLHFVREKVMYGNQLPYDHSPITDFCIDYLPVCHIAYIHQAIYDKCASGYYRESISSPYVTTDTCSSSESVYAFTEFVTCIRLRALAQEEIDCTIRDIVSIINDEEYKLNLYQKDTDLHGCIGDVADSLDDVLQNKEDVCQTSEGLGYFASICSRDLGFRECSTNGEMSDIAFTCSKYFLIANCTESMADAYNFTYGCSLDNIIEMDMSDTALELDAAEKDKCKALITYEFPTCQYQIYKWKEMFRQCYLSLHNMKADADKIEKCSGFNVSFNCFKEKITSMEKEFQCNADNLDDTVRDMMLSFLQIDAFVDSECGEEDMMSYTDMFKDCPTPTEPVDICIDDPVALTTIILNSCYDWIQEEFQEALSSGIYYKIGDEFVRRCGFYDKLITCGMNATNNMLHWCSYWQVDAALKDQGGRVYDKFASSVVIDPGTCAASCNTGTPGSRECLSPEILRTFTTYVDMISCDYGTKNYYWHCVKRELSHCADSKITAQVDFAMMNMSRYPSYCHVFVPSEEGPNMCVNYTDLNRAASGLCGDYVWAISVGWLTNQTCNKPTYTNLRECVGKILDLYSYDCYDRETAIDKGILSMTHRSQEKETIRRCFFDSERSYCPIRKGMEKNSGCDELEYELCLSDGQCDDEEKCCFDGCGISCIEPAMEPAIWHVQLEFLSEGWNDEYKSMNSTLTESLLSRFQVTFLLRDFSPVRLVLLNVTSDGALLLDVNIYSWYNPEHQLWDIFRNYEKTGLRFYSVRFVSQDYTIEEPDKCPDPRNLTCTTYYDSCDTHSQCGDGDNAYCCENMCGYRQCEYVEVDICSDQTAIVNAALACAQEQLLNSHITLADWEICTGVDKLMTCVQMKLGKQGYCDLHTLRLQAQQHKYAITMKLEESDFGQWTQITHAIRNYDYYTCQDNDFFDKYPCDSWKLKEEAWKECRQSINDMLINLTPSEMNNYNVTPDNCRQFYTVSSCVLSHLRERGAWCGMYDSLPYVYNKTREEIKNGHVLPWDMQKLDFCYEYLPVCTNIFLLEDNFCRRDSLYYMDDSHCHSENFTTEFTIYLTCLRLIALSREEEKDTCTLNRIIQIIAEDPFHLAVIGGNITDIRGCFGEYRINALESSLSSPEGVCRNPDILSYYADKCVRMGQDQCEVDWTDLMNTFPKDVVCTMYFKYTECIRQSLSNMTFECNTRDITNADIPELNLPDSLKKYCTDKLDDVPDFRECDYSVINAGKDVQRCYLGLENIIFMTSAFDKSRACSVFAEGVRCLEEEIQCYPDGSVAPTSDLLLQMLSANEIMQSNKTCTELDYVTDFYSYFGSCEEMATEDLCTNLPVLRDVTLLHCSPYIKASLMNFMRHSYNGSDTWFALCRFLDEMVTCGQNTTSNLGYGCPREKVLESLTASSSIVMQETMVPYVSGIDPSVCTGQCFEINDGARKCMKSEAIYELYMKYFYNDTLKCRVYDYMWHCVNKNMNYGMCDSSIIDNHLLFTLRETTGPYASWGCDRPSEVRDICMDHEALSYVGMVSCYDLMYDLFQGTTDKYGACYKKDEVMTCLSNTIDIYSSGCTQTERESTMNRAIIKAARRNNYNVEHCFVQKAGFCPYVDKKYRYCYGNEPTTCDIDSDCYDQDQKCCSDGCAFSCTDIATDPAEFLLMLQLKKESYSYNLYYDFYSTASQNLIASYKEKLKIFLLVDRYEIVGISEWERRVALEIKVWSYTDPHLVLSSNYTYSEDFYMVFLNYTSYLGEKDGSCPTVFEGYDRNNAYYNWCRQDRDCSGTHKCCPNKNNYKVCAAPGPVLPDCEDTGQLLVAASKCNISVLSLTDDLKKYTCKLLIEKFKCVMDVLNNGRPMFYECSGTAMKKKLFELLMGQQINTTFNIYTCSEWEVTLSYYEKSCEYGVVSESFEVYVVNNKLPALFVGYEYEYLGASCGSNNFKCSIASDKEHYELQDAFSMRIGTDAAFKNETVTVDVKRIPLEVDHCTSVPTLKQLGMECVKNRSFWYDDWQICSPVYRLAECINGKIMSHSPYWCDYQKIVTALFRNDKARQELLSELNSDSEMDPYSDEKKWIEVISRYSKMVCQKGDQDIYPCDDYDTKMGIFERCKQQSIRSYINIDENLPNYGITPDNCRDFFALTSCFLDEFSKLRVQCYGQEQYVYERLKESFDTKKVLPRYYDSLSFCADYQPVCSSLFIRDARHRCPWNQGYSYRLPDCRGDRDMEMTKKFVTCVRIFALAKYEEECTPMKIKEIINADYFKLSVLQKGADIDMCLPDEYVGNILPTRSSVCTSGLPVTLYERQCSRYNNMASYNGSYYNGSSYYNETYGNGSSTYGNGSSTYGNGSSTYHNGSSMYNNGSSTYGNGSSTYHNGSSTYYNGSSTYGNGSSTYHNGSSTYGNGSSTYHNGSSAYPNETTSVISNSSSRNDMSWPNYRCGTTAKGLAEDGSVDLACMLYMTQMSCVQVILTNLTFDCTMDQLVNSPVPSSSIFHLPNYRSTCLASYKSEEYQNCEASLMKSREAIHCASVLVNSTFLPDDETLLCATYHETLACLDDIATENKLSCSVNQLHNFQLNATALAAYGSRWDCDSEADRSPFEFCPAVLPQGDLCSNTDRLAKYVMSLCTTMDRYLPTFNSTQNIDKNVLTCKLLQFVIWCGTNVTMLTRSNCTESQVKSALLAKPDVVSAQMPELDLGVCQDSCYQTEEAVKECITPYVYIWNMEPCRIYTYMWQCLNNRLRQNNGNYCDGTTINTTIAVNLPQDRRYYLNICPDPREHPLDICTNVTDLVLLAGYTCTSYMYNMSRLNCKDEDKARNCYSATLSTFGNACYIPHGMVDKALILGGLFNGFNVESCVAPKFRKDGFCPFTYSSYCGGTIVNTKECTLDTDCDGSNKCCYANCNTTCRAPRPEPARWSGSVTFKNETFKSGMENKYNSVYQQFMDRYDRLLTVLFGEFYRYEIQGLRNGSVWLWYFIWSPQNPYDKMSEAVRVAFGMDMIHITLNYPSRNEEERPGQCPTYPDGIDNVCSFDTCEYDTDCPVHTAKCCWTNCYNRGYDTRRCIDLETPPITYKYRLVFLAQDSWGNPIAWRTQYMDFNSNESKSLVQSCDSMFQQMFINYFVLNLRPTEDNTVDLIMYGWSYKDLADLKQVIYMHSNGRLMLKDISYEDAPEERDCSDEVNSIGMKCFNEIWKFLYETDPEKKCMAFKEFMDCMGSGENCNVTQMRQYLREHIHDIGKSWLANSTIGVDSATAQSLYNFDPYKCDELGDRCPEWYEIRMNNLPKCNHKVYQFDMTYDPQEKCKPFEELVDCLIRDISYDSIVCNPEEIKGKLIDNFNDWSNTSYWNYEESCRGDEGSDKFCFDNIEVSSCQDDLTTFLLETYPHDQCRSFNGLISCLKRYFGDYCNGSQIEDYAKRNIHSIGVDYFGGKTGTGEPQEIYYLRQFDPYMCDIMLNRNCPKIPANMFGICAEECGIYSSQPECENGYYCCPNECGAHVCRPDMSVCSNIHELMSAMKEKASHCVYTISTDAYSFCNSFWSGASCIATALVGESFHDECMGMMKQVIRKYGELTIAEGVSGIIQMPVVFPQDPMLCTEDGEDICEDPSRVYHIIVSRCRAWLYRITEQHNEQDQCMAFEGLVDCVTRAKSSCNTKSLRMVLHKNIRLMAYRLTHLHSAFYGGLPTVSGPVVPLEPDYLSQFWPEKCSDILMIQPPKIFSKNEKLMFFVPGNPVTLPCYAIAHPVALYTWTKNGVDYWHPVNDFDGNLRFKSLKASDEGIYQCFAKNDYGVSVSVRVVLLEAILGSFPVIETQTVEVNAGTSLQLQCIPPQSRPPAEIYWMYTEENGEMNMVDLDNRVTINHEGALVFLKVEKSDEKPGNYSCSVINNVLRKSVTGPGYQIQVNEQADRNTNPAHKLWTTPSDIIAKVGETVKLMCIFGGDPLPDVKWMRQGSYINYDTPGYEINNFGMVLQIDSLELSHAGDYMCTGSNTVNTQTHVISLHIEAVPKFVTPLADVVATPGQTVTFYTVAEGIPEPSYIWYINGVPFKDLSEAQYSSKLQKPDEHTIIINDVAVDDRMNIQCNATNKHGYVFSDVFLNLKEEPVQWCPDWYEIKTDNMPKCKDIVNQFDMAYDDKEKCRYFEELVECLIHDLSYDNILCGTEEMKETLIDNFNDWSTMSYWNHDESCGGVRCSESFIESAKYMYCPYPFSKLMAAHEKKERCRHFGAFLGCLRFHITLNDEICPVRDLEAMVQKSINDYEISICPTCNEYWSVHSSNQSVAGEVKVEVDSHVLKNKNATVTIKAYNFKPEEEWMGVGISYDENMAKSDIMTAQMNYDGQWIVTDRFADGQYKPSPDIQRSGTDDIYDVWGSMIGETAVVHFSRPALSNDSRDVWIDFDRLLLFARGPLVNGDISQHDIGKFSNYFYFSCSPYDQFERTVPTKKEEICRSPAVHAHLWKYNCLHYDIGVISDPSVRCRSEISRRGCVLNIFNEAKLDCAMDDVIEQSQKPEVRIGLLDSVEPYCESKLTTDTPCEKHVYKETAHVEKCYAEIYQLFYLTYHKSVDEINEMLSSDNVTKLKCSMFEKTIDCILTNVPPLVDANGNTITCTRADIAVYLSYALYSAYEVISSMTLKYPGSPSVQNVPYEECVDAVKPIVPTRECPSHDYTAVWIVGRCASPVIEAVRGAGMTAGPCSAKEAFERCIDDMYLPHREMCPDGHVQKAIEENSGYISSQLEGFDPVKCAKEDEEKKCSIHFMEKAKDRECQGIYFKLNSASGVDICSHYVAFLGCVKYQTLLNHEDCHVSALDEMGRQLSLGPGYICFDYDSFEAGYPDTIEEICYSSSIVQGLLTYACIQYNYTLFTDPLDQCRAELSFRGCVQGILGKDAGCTMDQVEEVMGRDEVRKGLLDGISRSYCDSNLKLSQCELAVFMIKDQHVIQCLSPLLSLPFLNTQIDVNGIQSSAPGGGSLKCSLYNQTIRCFLARAHIEDDCTPRDLAPALSDATRMYTQVSVNTFQKSLPMLYIDEAKLKLDLSDCEANLPNEFPDWTCPTPYQVTDAVVGQCTASVLIMEQLGLTLCSSYTGYDLCLSNIALHPDCPDDYVRNTVAEQRNHISSFMNGFYPPSCKYVSDCSTLLGNTTVTGDDSSLETVDRKCFKSLSFAVYTSSVTNEEKCRLFHFLRPKVETCLSDNLPGYCSAVTSDLWDQKMAIYSYSNFKYSECKDTDPNVCSIFGLVGYSHCSNVFTTFSYSTSHCRFRSCFRKVAPPECNFSDSQIDQYAEEAYSRFLFGSTLAECSEKDQCTVELEDSGADHCYFPLRSFLALNETEEMYPNGDFNYTTTEGCGVIKLVSQCLKMSFPTDDEICLGYTLGIVQSYIYAEFIDDAIDFNIYMCPGDEEDIDECQSYDLFIGLQCHRLLPYSCNFKDCVKENSGKFSGCSNSLPSYETLYQKFTTHVFSCYGLYNSCMLNGCSDVRNSTCINDNCVCQEYYHEERGICLSDDMDQDMD